MQEVKEHVTIQCGHLNYEGEVACLILKDRFLDKHEVELTRPAFEEETWKKPREQRPSGGSSVFGLLIGWVVGSLFCLLYSLEFKIGCNFATTFQSFFDFAKGLVFPHHALDFPDSFDAEEFMALFGFVFLN